MKRAEIIKRIAIKRVEQCKKQNFEKFGNNDFPRQNENLQTWIKHYSKYPLKSKSVFSLENEYRRFYGEVI